MPRGLRLASIVAMTLAGALAMPVANAAPEVVRIADSTVRLFATANPPSGADNLVRMQPPQTTGLQSWSLDLNPPTVGTRVINTGTRGCLTISPSGPIIEGAPVVQLPCQNVSTELWRIVPETSTRTVRFINLRTELCLTIEPTSTGRFPLLRVFRCGNLRAQQFVLQRAG
jgi:Ricin-type beta-trefoil lectin domain-like